MRAAAAHAHRRCLGCGASSASSLCALAPPGCRCTSCTEMCSVFTSMLCQRGSLGSSLDGGRRGIESQAAWIEGRTHVVWLRPPFVLYGRCALSDRVAVLFVMFCSG